MADRDHRNPGHHGQVRQIARVRAGTRFGAQVQIVERVFEEAALVGDILAPQEYRHDQRDTSQPGLGLVGIHRELMTAAAR